MTKDEILNIVNNISEVKHQEGDFWRWEIIKTVARNRYGLLNTNTAQKAICNAAKYMPDMFLVQAYIDEFRKND
jgi:hypothetical protein